MNITHIGHSVIPTPLITILSSKTFCMFFKLLKIFYLFIDLPLAIMHLLNIFQFFLGQGPGHEEASS
jgi:hypothetical protein